MRTNTIDPSVHMSVKQALSWSLDTGLWKQLPLLFTFTYRLIIRLYFFIASEIVRWAMWAI